MSAYNLLGVAGITMSVMQIHERLDAQQHVGLDMVQLRTALDALVERDLVTRMRKGWKSKDRKGRPVIVRDKSDAVVDEEAGTVSGGWEGWQVRDGKRMMSVQEATA
jgi:hypothetical protein